MRFGLFGGAQARREGAGVDSGKGLRDYLEYNIEAEALGYHVTFLTEHHFTGIGQTSAPLQVLTALAMRTTTLRLGTGVIVLAWHNPVMLAEQAATLDLLSGGRLEFGIGKGYRNNEFSGFAMPMEEAEGRFEESFNVLKKAFTSEERFSHHGKYWHYDNVLVEPPPAQRPHPPMWIAAGNTASIKGVAARGCNLLLDQFQSPAQIKERIALFKSEIEEHGGTFDPMRVAVARNVYVAIAKADYDEAMQRQVMQHRRMVELSQRADKTNRSHILQYNGKPGSTEEHALFGTPDELVERLKDLETCGVSQVLANFGGISPSETLRRFPRHVMPALASSAHTDPVLSLRSPPSDRRAF